MLPPSECCLHKLILHVASIMGYYFTRFGWRTSFYNPSFIKKFFVDSPSRNRVSSEGLFYSPLKIVLEEFLATDEALKWQEQLGTLSCILP